jgi:hypothetical protein
MSIEDKFFDEEVSVRELLEQRYDLSPVFQAEDRYLEEVRSRISQEGFDHNNVRDYAEAVAEPFVPVWRNIIGQFSDDQFRVSDDPITYTSYTESVYFSADDLLTDASDSLVEDPDVRFIWITASPRNMAESIFSGEYPTWGFDFGSNLVAGGGGVGDSDFESGKLREVLDQNIDPFVETLENIVSRGTSR